MTNLLTAKETAERLGMSVDALTVLRHRGGGPAYIKFGRRIRYQPEDVEQWIKAQKVVPTR